MDVIPAKAGISPLLKRPVTMSGGVFFFKFVIQTLKVLSLGTAHTSERACELYKTSQFIGLVVVMPYE